MELYEDTGARESTAIAAARAELEDAEVAFGKVIIRRERAGAAIEDARAELLQADSEWEEAHAAAERAHRALRDLVAEEQAAALPADPYAAMPYAGRHRG